MRALVVALILLVTVGCASTTTNTDYVFRAKYGAATDFEVIGNSVALPTDTEVRVGKEKTLWVVKIPQGKEVTEHQISWMTVENGRNTALAGLKVPADSGVAPVAVP